MTSSNILSGVNCRHVSRGHHFGNTLFFVQSDMSLETMTGLSYVRMMHLSIDSHRADLFVTQAPVKSPRPLSQKKKKKRVKG